MGRLVVVLLPALGARLSVSLLLSLGLIVANHRQLPPLEHLLMVHRPVLHLQCAAIILHRRPIMLIIVLVKVLCVYQ